MPEWIEFHDSTLDSVRVDSNGTTLHLDAYVHRWERSAGGWAGSGWSQPVTIAIGGPAEHGEMRDPIAITDGCLTVDGSEYRNWLSVPFTRDGQVALWFDAMWTPTRLQFSGHGVRVEAAGAATFLESLDDDMRPDELADLSPDSQ